jgi:spermidine/putrescine-binding protein
MSPLPRKSPPFVWSRTALIILLFFGVQGCNRIERVNEDPTGISEEEFARQQALETGFGVHPSLSGFGQLIRGVVIPREIGPRAIRVSPEQEKIADRLLELYTEAARQAPGVTRELFHSIEALELRNRDRSALVWWLDREAIAYPDESAVIQEKKRALRDDGRYHGGRTATVHLLIWNEYFNQAILDDFERENQRINVRVYNYNSNEQLLQLLQTEADLKKKFNATSTPHRFDIAMPSDFCLVTLAEKGWLAPIVEDATPDRDGLQKNLALIDDDFRKLIGRQSATTNVDLNRYCIPYRWLIAGLAYNSAFIDEIPSSWAALFNPADLSRDAWRTLYRKTSMLLNPRLAIKTALLYLANMRTGSPRMSIIETAERLLRDSTIISEGLSRLTDDPVSRLLLDDLDRLLSNLREPRGHPLDEFAEVFDRLRDELIWVLLKLDAAETSAMPGISASAPSAGTVERIPAASSVNPLARSNPVIDSMRQLTLVTDDELRLAVSFLKKIADLQDRVSLLLTGSEPSGDGVNESETFPRQAREDKAFDWSREFHSPSAFNAPDCVRQAGALQVALRTLQEALSSERPPRLDELAQNFSALERRTNLLFLNPGDCSLKAKIETAIDLLFRGPGITEPAETERMVTLLTQQDTSEPALQDPETQTKINEALSFLQRQDSYISYYLTGSETRTELASGRVLLAQATGADAAWAAIRNGKIGFALPNEGVIGFVDCFVILKDKDGGAKPNIDACRTLLSYLLRPENAARMVNFSKSASTEEAAAAFIDPEIRHGAAYMRPRDLMNVTLLPVMSDQARKIYARAAAPLVPSDLLREHPEYRKTKSLFGVLFEVQRPN